MIFLQIPQSNKAVTPIGPGWIEERKQTEKWLGLPPLGGYKETGKVLLRNVAQVWTRTDDGQIEALLEDARTGSVLVESGIIICVGDGPECTTDAKIDQVLDLRGGSISPGFMAVGSRLGLEELPSEPSTADGDVLNAFSADVPKILHDKGGIARAMDGLVFRTRPAL